MKALRKIYLSVAFVFYYLYKLIQSNLYIAYDILTPKMRVDPEMIEVPIFIKSEFGILLFSNLLSMTPGTLTMDISKNRKTMFVHVLYKGTEKETMREIQDIQLWLKNITA